MDRVEHIFGDRARVDEELPDELVEPGVLLRLWNTQVRNRAAEDRALVELCADVCASV